MLSAVVKHFVVDFIRVNNQLVLASDLQNVLQQLDWIQSPGRVVGIDNDDGAGRRRDLGADIVQIRQPARLFVAEVVARRAAGEADRRRPQRIVRRGDQHLVAVVQQRLQRHHNQLGHPVTDVNILDLHSADGFLLGVVHHRLARREQAL